MTTLNEVIERQVNKYRDKFTLDSSKYKIGYTHVKGRTTADLVLEEWLISSHQELLKEVVKTVESKRRINKLEHDQPRTQAEVQYFGELNGYNQALEDIKALLIPTPPSTQPE